MEEKKDEKLNNAVAPPQTEEQTELEKLKEKVAREHGFELVGHKLELYCRPLKK